MSDKQCATQAGPGTRIGSSGKINVPAAGSAPSPSPSTSNPSGSSQGSSRGKQG